MDDKEKILIDYLVNTGKLTADLVPEIVEKMEIGLTMGEVLFGDNYIKEEELIEVLVALYKTRKITLDDIEEKFSIKPRNFLESYANTSRDLTYFNLDDTNIDYRIADRLPTAQLQKYEAFPIMEDDMNVYVAFKNHFERDGVDRIQTLFPRKILKMAICDPKQVEKYIQKLSLQESVKTQVAAVRAELKESGKSDGNTSGILELIETIISHSIRSRGSDIHIEPTETNCIVRTRIDGMLQELFIFDNDIYPPLISRLKMLSDMDIAEKRKPQDGRFTMKIKSTGKEYDFRISTLPIINGESTVLRILDKSKVLISLEKLGMHPETFKKFQNAMHAPYGIILVTGPTGSGKTTTLYAALNDMKSVDTKIITVEDPVEYQLNLIQQVHVNEKAGLTFAAALRSILRQDPDIIMIGEIRDQETLRIAIQAALTGHLVFSTLHTNDAISAIPRMVDMGIESYLISGSIQAVEAQRLVRRLCPKCKQPTTIPPNELEKIKQYLPTDGEITFYKPVGCDNCAGSGYTGREMISEVLPISDRLQNIIANGGSKEEMKQCAYEEGFIDMFHDGIIRAARGNTSVEEIYRVAKE